jgi:multidrug efflux system membrane fusion protein
MSSSSSTKSRRTGSHSPIFWNHRLGLWLVVLVIAAIISIYYTLAGHSTKKNVRNTQNVPVITAIAKIKDIPIYLTALGSVTPTYNVTVKTQINGILQEVLFREGQMVKKGDVLAQIDPRPYQAQLLQFQGQLIRDQALLDNALIDLKRYQTLWKQDSISQQTLITQKSLVAQYQGAVQIDKGQIEGAKINLIYCRITSPVNGRIGLRLTDPGNFVQTSDITGIAVVNTLNPITVIFTIPEDNIPAVQKSLDTSHTLLVESYDRQQTTLLATGSVITIDNQIDPNTGTVKLRAQFNNDHNHLFPSQFVNVRLLVDTIRHAVVVPTAAIQFSTKGHFVYLVNPDQTVTVTPIITSVTTGDETVVTSGITAGAIIVTEGADKLVNGAAITLAGHKETITNELTHTHTDQST